MTSKERAALRAQANRLEAVFQVGKEGATEAVAAQMLDALRTRELLKGKVLLESSPQPPRACADALAAMAGAEVVQVIGGVMVFFKENPELRKAEADKAKKARQAKQAKQVKQVKQAKIAAAKKATAKKAMAKPAGQEHKARTTAGVRRARHEERKS